MSDRPTPPTEPTEPEPPQPQRPSAPAPVITEEGLVAGAEHWDPPTEAPRRTTATSGRHFASDPSDEPMPPERFTDRPRPGGTSAGGALRRMLFVIAALAVSVWMAVAAMAAATDETAALPALGELIDALVDPAALLALHAEDLQADLDGGATSLTLPGFPGDITLPRAVATTPAGQLDPALARAALLDRAGRAVYLGGPDALFGAQPQTPSLLSDAGSVRSLMRSLHAGRHDTTLTLSWGAGLIALALLGALALLSRDFSRVAVPGGAVVLGGVLVAIAGFVVPRALDVIGVGPGGLLGDTYAEVMRDLSGAAVRNGVIAVAAGSALLLPAMLAGIVFGASRPVTPEPVTEAPDSREPDSDESDSHAPDSHEP